MALNCEDRLRQSLGRNLSDDEILDMLAEAKRLGHAARSRISAGQSVADIAALSQQWAQRKQLEALAKKRAIELQASARLSAMRHVTGNFQGMEWEGLSALLVGSKHNRRGGRLSVDSLRQSITGHYLGGLMHDLESLGPAPLELFRSGQLDRQVAEALWSIDNPAASYAGPGEAMQIAKALHKWQETARQAENAAGAWIGREPGYITRQTHSQGLMAKAGFEKWQAEIAPRLDWQRTGGGKLEFAGTAEREAWLREVYDNLVCGVHELTAPANPLTQRATTGSVAARASHERVLHFKSGGDWFEYNQLFGTGSLREGVIRGLTKSANDIALMRMLGPSPQANLESMITELTSIYRSRGDAASIKKLRAYRKRLANQMKELDGSLNMEGNPDLAAIGRNVRAIESMAKLGGAVLSGFSDIPLAGMEFVYQGRNFFAATGEFLASFVRGRGTEEQRAILAQCGVFFDSMAGSLAARFSGQERPGAMAAMMNLFFRLNGLSWWTDAAKKSATLMMAHDLAGLRGSSWAELSPRRRRVLSLYDLDEGQWDLLRQGRMQAADGREYFTPEAAFDAPEAGIRKYLTDQGALVSKERIAEFREEMAQKLRAYYRDRVQYAVLEPDARIGAILHQGTAAGTPAGEALRFATQFKSFPVVFLQRIFGREIYGRAHDTLGKGLGQTFIPAGGELSGMAGMIIMTSLFGYLSMCAKQLASGRSLRDFTESPEAFRKVAIAAMVQGGGLGIYGDFLFG